MLRKQPLHPGQNMDPSTKPWPWQRTHPERLIPALAAASNPVSVAQEEQPGFIANSNL
jgi:hypothetical protein